MISFEARRALSWFSVIPIAGPMSIKFEAVTSAFVTI
jgi:hypothetical protein